MTVQWTELAEKDAQHRLEQVERRRSEYRSRLAELDAEAEDLKGFISLVQKVGNDQYWKTLLGGPLDTQRGVEVDKDKLDWLATDLQNLGRLEGETQEPLQTRRFSDGLPDLPPALEVTRQPDRSNTSYRIAAIMKLRGENMNYDDVWLELQRRNWIDPSWTKPQAAVRQAMRRTVQYGWTKRVEANVYKYDPASHEEKRQVLLNARSEAKQAAGGPSPHTRGPIDGGGQ